MYLREIQLDLLYHMNLEIVTQLMNENLCSQDEAVKKGYLVHRLTLTDWKEEK